MTDLHSADAAAYNAGKLTDPRIAALAEALVKVDVESVGDNILEWWRWGPTKLAAAILAALPADWCGHGAEMEKLYDQIARQAAADGTLAVAFDEVRAEARLRRIEGAARNVLAVRREWRMTGTFDRATVALRAALEDGVEGDEFGFHDIPVPDSTVPSVEGER